MASARMPEFLRFALVGFAGFLADALMLEFFVGLGFTASLARVLSIVIALHVTYILHGVYTFKGNSGFSKKRWLQYLLYNAIGALLNYVTFLGVLHTAPLNDPQPDRLLALVIGTAVALLFNYFANRTIVFRADR